MGAQVGRSDGKTIAGHLGVARRHAVARRIRLRDDVRTRAWHLVDPYEISDSGPYPNPTNREATGRANDDALDRRESDLRLATDSQAARAEAPEPKPAAAALGPKGHRPWDSP